MKYLPTIALIIIVIFVNFDKDTPLWDLIYYLQSYLYVGFFISIIWMLRKSVITRSILIALSLYYGFELFMDVLRVFNEPLYDKWYTTRLINYILSFSCCLSIFIYPITNLFKKCKH